MELKRRNIHKNQMAVLKKFIILMDLLAQAKNNPISRKQIREQTGWGEGTVWNYMKTLEQLMSDRLYSAPRYSDRGGRTTVFWLE